MIQEGELPRVFERLRPPKKNLYVVRHGQSVANVSGRLERDPGLTDEGRNQSVFAGRELRNFLGSRNPAAIVHTGLERTSETAAIMKSAGGFGAPLIEMPEFREREMGIYEQVDFAELLKGNPKMQLLYERYGSSCVWFYEDNENDGVEALGAMKTRVLRGIEKLHFGFGDEPVVIVGHAGSIKILRFLYEKPNLGLAQYLSSYVPKNGEITGLGITIAKT